MRILRAAYVAVLTSLGLLLSACSVPNHMHVTEGISPKNIDTNVRFRTTYYFRIFDYCWQIDQIVDNQHYRNIIPETDVMFRYRMTGKASALGSKIKFESGTLNATDIDPFGSDAVYHDEIGGYVVRTAGEAKDELAAIKEKAAAAQNGGAQSALALARFKDLEELHSEIATHEAGTTGDARAALDAQLKTVQDAMVEALHIYLGTAPTSDDVQKKLETINADLVAIQRSMAELKPALDDATQAAAKAVANATAEAFIARLQAIVDQAKAAPTSAAGAGYSGMCPANSILRHGFQVMGPEGMVPFDQDKRLILAMHTSADPLIDTLREYAGRVLKDKVNPAEQMLPLVQENLRVVQGQRALSDMDAQVSGTGGPDVKQITDSLIDAFDPQPPGATSASAKPGSVKP